jgi:hypothetical protein
LVIGRLHDITGDFRAGLGLAACLAMAVSLPFYLIGRARQGAASPQG